MLIVGGLVAVIRAPGGTVTGGLSPFMPTGFKGLLAAMGYTFIREALSESFSAGAAPEALTTISPEPWQEIARVSRSHHCDSLLLGFSRLSQEVVSGDLERLVSQVDCNLTRFLQVEAPGTFSVKAVRSDDLIGTVVTEAAGCDLVLLGLRRHGKYKKVFGPVTIAIAGKTDRPLMMISRRG